MLQQSHWNGTLINIFLSIDLFNAGKKTPVLPKKAVPCVHLSIYAFTAQTSELLWQSCILTTSIGSVLTDPFTTSCTPPLPPSFQSFCLDLSMSVMMTMMRTVSSTPTRLPTTVSRPSSVSSAFSSSGSNPPAKSSSDTLDFLLVRSKKMCMMLVPRLLSMPISSATAGIASPADLLLRGASGLADKARLSVVETKEWYSRLRFPMPLLTASFERTV